MKSNTLKKILTLILAAGIIFSAVACDTSEPSDSSDKSDSTSQQESDDSDDTSGDGEKSYDEKLTISIATTTKVEDSDWDTKFHQYFMEEYNIEWDYYHVEWNNWAETMRVWINAGDLPDLATWNYVHGEAVNYIEQEVLYKLPDDWKTNWPNVAAAYETTGLGPILEEDYGGTYILPRPIYVQNTPADPVVNQIGVIAIRKDWAEAVDFELKDAYTVDEMIEYAELLKENDPGGLGDQLIPLAFDPSNALTTLVTANYENSRVETHFYKDDNGEYKWGPADQETLEALKIYQQAYKDGLLGPEFYTKTDAEHKELFYLTGQSGVYQMGGLAGFRQDLDSQMNNNLSLDSDEVVHSAIILGNDGKHHNITQGANYWSSLLFSPDIEEAKFERVMDLIDFTTTQEGQNLVHLGFEGEDWEVGADGEIVNLLEEGTTLNDKYPNRFESLYILNDDFAMINPALDKAYRDRSILHYQDKASYGEGGLAEYDWDYQLFSSRAKNQTNFDYPTEYANLILQEGDLEANWNTWVEEKMSLVQPVLDELNAM